MQPSTELTYIRGIFGILFACPGYLNQGHAEMSTSSNRNILSSGESDEQGVILNDMIIGVGKPCLPLLHLK